MGQALKWTPVPCSLRDHPDFLRYDAKGFLLLITTLPLCCAAAAVAATAAAQHSGKVPLPAIFEAAAAASAVLVDPQAIYSIVQNTVSRGTVAAVAAGVNHIMLLFYRLHYYKPVRKGLASTFAWMHMLV